MARSVKPCNLVAARPRSSRAVPADVFLPLAGHAKAVVLGFLSTDLNNMRLAPAGAATEVIWAMQGKVPFMGKLMSLVMNCEKMCGTQFEEGLAKLKSVAEQRERSPVAA